MCGMGSDGMGCYLLKMNRERAWRKRESEIARTTEKEKEREREREREREIFTVLVGFKQQECSTKALLYKYKRKSKTCKTQRETQKNAKSKVLEYLLHDESSMFG